MTTYKTYIEELQKQQPLKLEFINFWLKENRINLNNAIKKTECHKWKKWQSDNSFFVLPCIHNCKECDKECCFIEFYKSLQDFLQTIRCEAFYQNQLEIYHKIKHNQGAVFEWIIDIEPYGKELTLINDEVYYKFAQNANYVTIELDKAELPNLWKFKEIFEEHYYSLDFHNHLNP